MTFFKISNYAAAGFMAFSMISFGPPHFGAKHLRLADSNFSGPPSYWLDPASNSFNYRPYQTASKSDGFQDPADKSKTASDSFAGNNSPDPTPTPKPTPTPTPKQTPTPRPKPAAADQPAAQNNDKAQLALNASNFSGALGQAYRSSESSLHSGLNLLNDLSPSSLYRDHGINPSLTRLIYLSSGILAVAGASMIVLGNNRKK